MDELGHNLLADLSLGQLIGILSTVILIVGLIRKLNPIMKRLNNLLDDWFGEQARPGVKARKGVMQRLSDQDDALKEVNEKIEPLIVNSHPDNHLEVVGKLDEIYNHQTLNQKKLKSVERLLQQHIKESKIWVREVSRRAAERDFEAPPWPDLSSEVTGDIPDDGDDSKEHT